MKNKKMTRKNGKKGTFFFFFLISLDDWRVVTDSRGDEDSSHGRVEPALISSFFFLLRGRLARLCELSRSLRENGQDPEKNYDSYFLHFSRLGEETREN